MKPYYSDDLVQLFHGDCREVTEWLAAAYISAHPQGPVEARHP